MPFNVVLTVSEAHELIQSKTASLIDVRELDEHKAEHIAGDSLIPHSELFAEKLTHHPAPIILYCRSGKRSSDAAHALREENPELQVCSLDGGLVAWKAAGHPTIKAPSSRMPLMQQTQLVAGLLIFAGMLIGLFAHPYGFALPVFVSIGLVNAGLTGACTMTSVLAAMPWNKGE
jgi:rhodanese-related sulfurtransferase